MTEPPNPVKLNVAYAVPLLFKKALASSVWIRFSQTIGQRRNALQATMTNSASRAAADGGALTK